MAWSRIKNISNLTFDQVPDKSIDASNIFKVKICKMEYYQNM